MSRTIERTESQAMQEVWDARAKLHEMTKDMTFEQRQEFFAKEKMRFEELARNGEEKKNSTNQQ